MVEVPSDWLKAFPTDTASGAIASFTDGADGLPLKSLVVDINPVQDLSHGDPSPENICPISGWTQVDVNQSRVNVWDEEWELGDISASTGENVVSNAVIRTKNYIPVKPNTQYFVYINNSGSGPLRSRFYGINKDFIGTVPKDRASVAYNQTFVTPDNCYYMRFTPQAAYGTTYNHDISINYPSTDHDYHPYTGRSITISLGQTVYGGKLDVLSGVLTVDRANIASYNGETLPSTWISDRDAYASGTTPTTSAQVVYQLATPLEIQLTPNQVNSLLGVNNIWADSGDTEVVYRADPDLYIQRKMSEVPVEDVQINGTSIVNNGVANVPVASANNVGVVKILSTNGIYIDSNNSLAINKADTSQIKNGAISSRPIVPANQSNATFYGLAKSAGDTTQSQSSNAVGSYTEDAKSKISEMLNGAIQISGTDPVIVAKSGIRYVCGEVLSLNFTPSTNGICDVVFTSGSTPTVLTVPNTVRWANDFDPTNLETNTTYEINIMDGSLAVVGTW